MAVTFMEFKSGGYEFVVDHKDNDKSNNKLDNLQIITTRKNTSKNRKDKTSQYTGVNWSIASKKWKSGIRVKSKHIHLGYFESELEASKAYNNYIKINNL